MPKKTIKKSMTILISLFLVFILTAFMRKANAEGITYDQNNRLLTVNADTTSFMAILHDVEAKTGIKMTIGGGVPDKYVTLNMKQLPISQIDVLLDELPLANKALVYDKKGDVSEIIILPEGKTVTQVYRGRRR